MSPKMFLIRTNSQVKRKASSVIGLKTSRTYSENLLRLRIVKMTLLKTAFAAFSLTLIEGKPVLAEYYTVKLYLLIIRNLLGMDS